MQWLLETSCYFDLPVISWVFATVPYCRSIDGSNSLHFFALNWNRYTVLVWGNEAQLCHLMLCECIVFFCKHQSSNNRRWICSASSTIVFKVWDVFGVCTRTTLFHFTSHISSLYWTVDATSCHTSFIQVLCGLTLPHRPWCLAEAFGFGWSKSTDFFSAFVQLGQSTRQVMEDNLMVVEVWRGNVWMCFNFQLFIFDVYCHIILMLVSQMRKVP